MRVLHIKILLGFGEARHALLTTVAGERPPDLLVRFASLAAIASIQNTPIEFQVVLGC